MNDTQKETVVVKLDSEADDELTFWPVNGGVQELKGKTLIVACGSFASIEGLACDYIIEALKLSPVGVFTSTYIEALVQTLDGGRTIATGMELYGGEDSAYMVLQLRSSYRKKGLLGRALSRWITSAGFSRVLGVSSMSSHVQDDSDLEVDTPLRGFRTENTSFGLPVVDKNRIIGGGLITRLDEDIPGLLCFAKGTDVEKLPLARIMANFLLTNVCGLPEAPTDLRPASWLAIQQASGYGRYDDEEDLRRMWA